MFFFFFEFSKSIGYNALLNFLDLNPEQDAVANVFYLVATDKSINAVGQCIITEHMRNAKTALYIWVRLDSRQLFFNSILS